MIYCTTASQVHAMTSSATTFWRGYLDHISKQTSSYISTTYKYKLTRVPQMTILNADTAGYEHSHHYRCRRASACGGDLVKRELLVRNIRRGLSLGFEEEDGAVA
jgi:hypothetical protein